MITDDLSDPRASEHLSQNLLDLQIDSLRTLALLTGALGYGALFFVVWPITGGPRPPLILWLSVLICLAGAIAAFVSRERSPRLAAHLLVWATLLSLILIVLYLDSPTYSFVLVIPVIFASVLVGRSGFVLVAAASNLAGVGAILLAIRHTPTYFGDVRDTLIALVPTIPTLLVTLCAWLSSSNLQSALTWVWGGYEQAHRNEQLARDRAGELARALHALEEASFRLDRANYLLALARDRAEEARRLKQQFAQNISHELRTPVNLIIGFAELMTESPQHYGAPLATSYQRDLNIIHRNATHLQQMVNDVLDLARIDAAQMSILPEDVDVAELVQEVGHTVGALVEGTDLNWSSTLPQGCPMSGLIPPAFVR